MNESNINFSALGTVFRHLCFVVYVCTPPRTIHCTHCQVNASGDSAPAAAALFPVFRSSKSIHCHDTYARMSSLHSGVLWCMSNEVGHVQGRHLNNSLAA